MRYFFSIAALLYCSLTLSQSNTISRNKKIDVSETIEGPIGCAQERVEEKVGEKETTCTSVEVDAQVKDQRHWLMYLTQSLLLDQLAQDTIPAGVYNIAAFFIIDKEGQIANVKVQNEPGYGLGKKVINVISHYKEKWYPATRNGRNVKAYKKQVVTIIVENKKCKLQEEIKEFIL